MSRIAGIIRFADSSPDRAAASLNRMLAVLPGKINRTVTKHPCALGWRGTGEGRGGGAVEAAGLLVTLDGQIYNGPELRGLTGNLYAGDAGLLAALYRRFGFMGMLARLNGDFAIALWDEDAGTLWLGRDRVGVKPLYHAAVAGGIAFASQPRALLALPEVPRDVNRRFAALVAGGHYRSFDGVAEESPYGAIGQVPAAEVLEVRADGLRRHRYWSLENLPDLDAPEEELAEEYRGLLTDAVAVRLAAAGRSAFTLSGGMDSSSVLCSAVDITGARQHAFSSVYEDRTYDERDDIADLLDGKVERWHPVEIGNDIDVFGMVRRLVRIHDEPVATATWLSHHMVCDAVASSGFDSLFGGLGGDELNAGEFEYFPFFFADLRADGDAGRLVHEIGCWAHHHDHPIHRKDASVAEAMLAARTDSGRPGRCLPDMPRLTRYMPAVSPGWYDLAGFEPTMDRPFQSHLKNRAWHDIARETVPCCLRAEDRQSAAAGLIHFDPFLDHRLIEFMFRIPGRLKIRDGVTKHLLRQAMRGRLPEATRGRVRKTGWNAPAHKWFGGRNLEELIDIVGSRSFGDHGIYDLPVVRRLIQDHRRIVESGAVEENHMMFLWQLVNVHFWMEHLAETG